MQALMGVVAMPLILLPALAANSNTLETRLAACLACHGANGQSATPEVPSLGGQPVFYLTVQLLMFRDTARRRTDKPADARTQGRRAAQHGCAPCEAAAAGNLPAARSTRGKWSAPARSSSNTGVTSVIKEIIPMNRTFPDWRASAKTISSRPCANTKTTSDRLRRFDGVCALSDQRRADPRLSLLFSAAAPSLCWHMSARVRIIAWNEICSTNTRRSRQANRKRQHAQQPRSRPNNRQQRRRRKS